MEKHTILQNNDNMYWGYDFEPSNTIDVNNKLFATFIALDDLDSLIDNLKTSYSIMYNKMFVRDGHFSVLAVFCLYILILKFGIIYKPIK